MLHNFFHAPAHDTNGFFLGMGVALFSPEMMLKLAGLLIALVSLGCGVSREIRGWRFRNPR